MSKTRKIVIPKQARVPWALLGGGQSISPEKIKQLMRYFKDNPEKVVLELREHFGIGIDEEIISPKTSKTEEPEYVEPPHLGRCRHRNKVTNICKHPDNKGKDILCGSPGIVYEDICPVRKTSN